MDNSGGILIHGAVNSGADKLLHKIINLALCQAPINNEPCGECSACKVFALENHPDYFHLEAEELEERKNATIKIEQIRRVIDFASTSVHLSKRKIIYLADAKQLNLNSANALLKILEEPPSNCLFIIYAANINRILPTILSRCFKYQLHLPTLEQALAVLPEQSEENSFWLQYFDGEPFFEAPFASEQLELFINGLQRPSIEMVFELSKNLDPKKLGMANLVDFMLKWLSDLLILKQGGVATYFTNEGSVPLSLLARLNLDKLFALQEELVFLREWSEHPLNHKLQFENLLFKYQQIYV
jgi:DNA polymerase-3 subunit delta'